MSLVKCRECSKDLSTKVKSCPNCGAPVKKNGNNGFLKILTVLAVISIVAYITSYFTEVISDTKPNFTEVISYIMPKEDLTLCGVVSKYR